MSGGNSQFADEGRIEVKLLGGLQVRLGETVLGPKDLGGCKPRQVLEILVLNRGTPVSKDRLIDLIWGDAAPPEALPTLESYISILRRRIQPGRSKTGPLRTVTSGYVMQRELLSLDLDRFDELIEQARQAGAARAYPLLLQALAIASDPLLADEPTASWAEMERQSQAARVGWALTAAARAATELGNADDGVRLARKALGSDRLDEGAWCALLTALQSAGRHAEALHSYEQCRQMFIDELGCAPGPALQQLHSELLQGAADSDGGLSDLLSALLCLHAHTAPAGPSTPPPAAPVPSQETAVENIQPLREASRVLSNLLRQAQVVLQTQLQA
jgi:SARP family transcriptional regulator, regulator of embCAB operon